MDYLDKCLEIIINKYEGGSAIVNHSKDPGGLTKYGISKKVYPHIEIEYLSYTDALAIYREDYAKKIMFNETCLISPRFAFSFLDFAINSGSFRAIKSAQKVAKVNKDGIMGPQSLAALTRLNDGEGNLAALLNAERARFLAKLDKFDTFGRGWMRRVMQISTENLA